jgi:hypothetical protein
MKKEKLVIVFPPTASTNIDNDLVNLTEFLSKKLKLETGFGLGGEFGYGVDFENDTFMMHHFCWCGQDNCDWCAMNGKRLQKRLLKKYGNKEWAEGGIAPNFWYKPTGFMIEWYKWIGRDMEFSKKLKPAQWKKIYKDCIKSVK